jgi:small subunit ribosomal protein S3
MGQKVSPVALRLGINQEWASTWFADKKNYGRFVIEDEKIRRFIKKEYCSAGIEKIEIMRNPENIIILLHCLKPSFVIGRGGVKVDRLTEDVMKLTRVQKVDLKVVEVARPELSAQLVAESIVAQLEKRAPHRRVMHKAIETVMNTGALGIKIRVSGRIGGIEIARSEALSEGKIPLHTFKAQIDYARATAVLTKGTVGVKCWIYKGDAIKREKKPQISTEVIRKSGN